LHGELPKYYVKGSHEPIIDRETFNKVQDELKRRSEKYNHKAGKAPKYAFTGKIICGNCGKNYNRKTNNAGTKYSKIVWICPTFNQIGKAACDAKQIPEDILLRLTSKALGTSEFEEGIFMKKISHVEVPEHGKLLFVFQDQRKVEVSWDYSFSIR